MKLFCVGLVGLVLSVASSASATNYYVSADGDDSASGTSESSAWRSIEKVNAFAASLRAGDSVLFRRGDSFHGAVVISAGGAEGNPIRFGAFGTGERPIISGLHELSSWTDEGDGIYSATVPVAFARLTSVIVEDRIQPIGRFPRLSDADGGYLAFESHSGNTTITDAEFPMSMNFVGAEIVVRLRRWILARVRVTSQSGNSVTFESNDAFMRYAPTDGSGYFFQNHPATLLEDGDWYYDASTGTVYMRSSSAPSAVRVPDVEDLIVSSGRAHLAFSDLAFEGSNGKMIFMENASDLRVENCTFNFAGSYALHVRNSSHIVFDNNVVTSSVNNGVEISGSMMDDVTVRHNRFVNTGPIAGMGLGGDVNSHEALGVRIRDGVLIEYNTIEDTGFIPIRFAGNNLLIKNNVIDRYCYVKDDGGAIYTWNGGNPVVQLSNRVITGNIISNGIGVPYGTASHSADVEGIYLDNNTNHVDVVDNTVFAIAASGFYANSLQDATVTGNTFYDNGQAVGLTRYINDGSNPTNGGQDFERVVIRNNVMFARRAAQLMVRYHDNNQNFPESSTWNERLRTIGDFDGNLHREANPFSYAYSYGTGSGSPVFPPAASLRSWRNWTGLETTSSVMAPLPEYDLRALATGNLVTVGEFDSSADVGSVGSYSGASNHTVTWDDTSKLSGTGSLRLAVHDPQLRAYTTLFDDFGAVDSSKSYVVRVSTLGTNDDGALRVAMRLSSGTYETIVPYQYRAFHAERVDHEFLFEHPPTSAAVSWELGFLQTEGDTYVDSVQVYEADAASIDPERYLRFEYNATDVERSIALDASYVDARGNSYATSMTLAPFSSVVLVRTSGPGPVLLDGGVESDGGPGYDAGILPYDSGLASRDAAMAEDGGGAPDDPTSPLHAGCACQVPLADAGNEKFGALIAVLGMLCVLLRMRTRASRR